MSDKYSPTPQEDPNREGRSLDGRDSRLQQAPDLRVDVQSRRQVLGFSVNDLPFLLLISWYVLLAAWIALVMPFLLVSQTLTQSQGWIFGHQVFYGYIWFAFSLVFAGMSVYIFIVGYSVKRRPIVQMAMFIGAVAGNIYLGYAVWWAAVKLFMIPIAASNSGRFGLMVWWNLLHGVPLLNIDSVLNWEQPIEEYPAPIGWLFLLQQIALLLTLARSIQAIVSISLEDFDLSPRARKRVYRQLAKRELRRQAKGKGDQNTNP